MQFYRSFPFKFLYLDTFRISKYYEFPFLFFLIRSTFLLTLLQQRNKKLTVHHSKKVKKEYSLIRRVDNEEAQQNNMDKLAKAVI